MTRNFVRAFCGRYLAVLVLCGAGTAGAQNTPEVREILSRLDRLEKDNQTLTEEVRSLRKELATLRAPAQANAPAAEVASDGQQSVDERLDVHQSRLDELAQTKVEASQKFPIRITGMALFNAYVNGRHNNQADNPIIASLDLGDSTGGGTLRQSTIGLLFDGPKMFGGGKVSGSFYMDFFGGSTASLNHLVRLRTAGIHLDWTNTSVMIGQDKPLISPRDPDSLAQVGVSPLTAAGNPWLWQPQIRVEQRFGLGENGGVRAQAAVFQTSFLNSTGDPNVYVPATEYSKPGGEGRVELWRRWGETGRLEIAGGIHVNRNRVGQVSVPTDVYSVDWFFRPLQKLEFSGLFFHGRNVSVLGALRPGFTFFPGERVMPVRTNGGWGQLHIPVTSRVAFNLYGGQQSNYESDILAGNISSNAAYFGNVMYRFAPNVILSFEGGQVRTTYFRIGNRLNDHYDLAIAYLF
ncbi:MAG TPA: hypothetical protein VEU96_30135 [Bryobacteraceae bacterium]|nr:hypothetical protein [Bryobacteraceae bacterium]